MGQAVPRQHPAVVLRSRYTLVRTLLAIAMIAVAGLSVAVVILAGDSDEVISTSAAKPVKSIRYGDFNPATGRPESADSVAPKDYSKNSAARDVPPRGSSGSEYGTSQYRLAQP